MKASSSRERFDKFVLGFLVGGIVGAVLTALLRSVGYFVLKHEIDGLDLVKIGVAVVGAFWLQAVISRREDKDKKRRDFVIDEVKLAHALLEEICSEFKKSCAEADKSEFNNKVQRLGMKFADVSRLCEQVGAERMDPDVFLEFRTAALDDRPYSEERNVALITAGTKLRTAFNEAAFQV
jgi:hypothetical protein